MSESYYREENSWSAGEFPYDATTDKLAELTEVLPDRYEFYLRAEDGDQFVHLFEYVGQYEGMDDE